jgi:hypothetical protein
MTFAWAHVPVFLLQAALAAVVTVLAFVGLAPTKLGERFLNHHLEKKLADLRHDQNQQIEKLKEQLGHIGDRGIRSNEREFNAISAVWESFVDAYVSTQRCAIAYTEHPDLSRLSEEEVESFLTSTDLRDRQRKEVQEARDKNRAYSAAVNNNYISEAGKAIYDTRTLLRKQCIFVPEDLTRLIEFRLNKLSEAYVQRRMEPTYGAHSEIGAVEFLLTHGNTMFDELLAAVRLRLLRP